MWQFVLNWSETVCPFQIPFFLKKQNKTKMLIFSLQTYEAGAALHFSSYQFPHYILTNEFRVEPNTEQRPSHGRYSQQDLNFVREKKNNVNLKAGSRQCSQLLCSSEDVLCVKCFMLRKQEEESNMKSVDRSFCIQFTFSGSDRVVTVFLAAFRNLGQNLWGPHRYGCLNDVQVSCVVSGPCSAHSLLMTTEGKLWSWGK